MMYRTDNCPECGRLNTKLWNTDDEVIFYNCQCGYSGLMRVLNKTERGIKNDITT